MSIMRCSVCEEIFDTDNEEGGLIDDDDQQWACDYCYERYLEVTDNEG